MVHDAVWYYFYYKYRIDDHTDWSCIKIINVLSLRKGNITTRQAAGNNSSR